LTLPTGCKQKTVSDVPVSTSSRVLNHRKWGGLQYAEEQPHVLLGRRGDTGREPIRANDNRDSRMDNDADDSHPPIGADVAEHLPSWVLLVGGVLRQDSLPEGRLKGLWASHHGAVGAFSVLSGDSVVLTSSCTLSTTSFSTDGAKGPGSDVYRIGPPPS